MARYQRPEDRLRRQRYQAVHPDVRIGSDGGGRWWQAVISEQGGGETVIIRFGLRDLLDALEANDGSAGKHAP
jgi:hypothetical protein